MTLDHNYNIEAAQLALKIKFLYLNFVYENFRAARENLKKVGKMSGYKSDEDKPVKRVKKSKINCGSKRAGPNILVTGTPGTGKSTLCRRLVDGNTLKWINVGDFATQAGCLGEWDERYDCHELDEDKLIDELEDIMAEGNVVVEHHVTDIFPERWFDAVFVLRTSNTQLYDRLKQRNYNAKKLEDNVQCEIFQTILDEAQESYKPEIVHQLFSNQNEEIETNALNILHWVQQWKKDNH